MKIVFTRVPFSRSVILCDFARGAVRREPQDRPRLLRGRRLACFPAKTTSRKGALDGFAALREIDSGVIPHGQESLAAMD